MIGYVASRNSRRKVEKESETLGSRFRVLVAENSSQKNHYIIRGPQRTKRDTGERVKA